MLRKAWEFASDFCAAALAATIGIKWWAFFWLVISPALRKALF